MLLKRLGFDPAASSAPFVAITIVVIATDNCTIVSKKIVSVTSDEPGSAEWEITGNLTLLLRAERNGSGSGHTYTVTVEVTDSSGNASRRRVDVAVPGAPVATSYCPLGESIEGTAGSPDTAFGTQAGQCNEDICQQHPVSGSAAPFIADGACFTMD